MLLRVKCKHQLDVTLVDTVGCITDKRCDHHKLMSWFVDALLGLLLVNKLLTSYGEKHANTSTNNDCKTRMHLVVHVMY